MRSDWIMIVPYASAANRLLYAVRSSRLVQAEGTRHGIITHSSQLDIL